MSIEIETDVASYLDWSIETGLWDGRLISRFEASDFYEETIRRLAEQALENPARFAWIGTAADSRSLLAREIQHLDFSNGDLVLQVGFKKSLSHFWKKHKKEILIGAAIVAAVTVVAIVAASAAGAAAAAGGAAFAGNDKDKPSDKRPRPKETPPKETAPQPQAQLVFEEAGIFFDGNRTSYSDILLNRIEPTLVLPYRPEELQPPSSAWPEVALPSYRDVQPHYAVPWGEFDWLEKVPPQKEPFPEMREMPFLEMQEPLPIPKETGWFTNFAEALGNIVVENPHLLEHTPHLGFLPTSSIFSIPGIEKPWMSIIMGNGMNTSQEEALDHANHLAQFTKGHRVDLVYNRSHGPVVDMAEILTLNMSGCSPITAELHLQLWTAFHARNGDKPHAKVLQICHSQDTIHVLNALNKAPKEVQNRVIVVAFGPPVIIPDDICFRAIHVACKGDIVPLGGSAYDKWALLHCCPSSKGEGTIIWVDKHPDTKSPHDFQNPAFIPAKGYFIDDYIQNNGEYPPEEDNSIKPEDIYKIISNQNIENS